MAAVVTLLRVTTPSTNPAFNVFPRSVDVYVEVTQANVVNSPKPRIEWGDGDTSFPSMAYDGTTSYPNAVWRAAATFSHNYAADGTYTVTADGDGTNAGGFGLDDFTMVPLAPVTQTITVFGERPPLAHRQRADGTATAGPPLAHIGTAGGRPPLAWRQNTP